MALHAWDAQSTPFPLLSPWDVDASVSAPTGTAQVPWDAAQADRDASEMTYLVTTARRLGVL